MYSIVKQYFYFQCQFEEVSKLKECANLQDCLFLSVFKLKQSKEWGKDLGETRFMRHIMAVLYWEQYCILEQCVTLVEQSRRAKAFEKSPAGCHKQCAEDTRIHIWKKSYLKEHSSIFEPIQAGGPPLTRKSLTQSPLQWFPLPWFLAYIRASGGFSR